MIQSMKYQIIQMVLPLFLIVNFFYRNLALLFVLTCIIVRRYLLTLISLINVEDGIFRKKLVHNSNKRGVEGGKI